MCIAGGVTYNCSQVIGNIFLLICYFFYEISCAAIIYLLGGTLKKFNICMEVIPWFIL